MSTANTLTSVCEYALPVHSCPRLRRAAPSDHRHENRKRSGEYYSALLGKMRCLASLAEWEKLSALCAVEWDKSEPHMRCVHTPIHTHTLSHTYAHMHACCGAIVSVETGDLYYDQCEGLQLPCSPLAPSCHTLQHVSAIFTTTKGP